MDIISALFITLGITGVIIALVAYLTTILLDRLGRPPTRCNAPPMGWPAVPGCYEPDRVDCQRAEAFDDVPPLLPPTNDNTAPVVQLYPPGPLRPELIRDMDIDMIEGLIRQLRCELSRRMPKP